MGPMRFAAISGTVLVVSLCLSSMSPFVRAVQVAETLTVGGASGMDVFVEIELTPGAGLSPTSATDSDTDSTTFSGTVDVLVDVEYDVNTGLPKIGSFELTGGNVVADDDMTFNLDYDFTLICQI